MNINDNIYIRNLYSNNMPLLPPGQNIYVSKNGLLTGTGTILNPFLTINQAINSIVDASLTKKYVVMIGAGAYTENIILKPNVSLVGSSILDTEIIGIIQLSSNWATLNSESCVIQNLTVGIGSTVDLNYYALSINQSLVVFQNSVINAPISALGSGLQNLTILRGCVVLDNITIVSGFYQAFGTFVPQNNTSIQSAVGRASQVILFGTQSFGTINVLSPVGADPINLLMFNSPSATLSLNGANVTCFANGMSIPSIANTTLLNSAVLNRVSDAFCLAYTPSTPGNWSDIPTTVQEGLDNLAAMNSGYTDNASKPTITFSAGTPNASATVKGNRNKFRLSVTTDTIGIGLFPLCYINHVDYALDTIAIFSIRSLSGVNINQLSASPSGWYVNQSIGGQLELHYGVSTDLQPSTTYEFDFTVSQEY